MTVAPWVLKLLPYVGAVALVGGAVWYIDHRGYERAEEEAKARETERQLFQAQLEIKLQRMVNDSETRMAAKIIESDQRITEQLANIDQVNRTIVQPTLIKEIQNEARLSDPSAGITDGMRGAINSARGLSSRPCPAGSNAVACFSLSPAEPAD